MKKMILSLFVSCFFLFCFVQNGSGAGNTPSILLRSKPKTQCIQFSDLWKHAETGNPAPEYKYQCAIRLSITLHNVGIDMQSLSQKTVKPAPGCQTLGCIIN